MSKKLEATIGCPKCRSEFQFTLFRSIWGEYPENRELVMSDKINVAICPNCNQVIKIPFAFIYTNTKQYFAVWWEPEYDAEIDSDSRGYTQLMGEGNYLATAPRIKEWDEFKQTILKFERGELKGKPPVLAKAMQDRIQGFGKQLENKPDAKQSSGCLGIVAFIFLLMGSLFSVCVYLTVS